jgi:hypothetical protein
MRETQLATRIWVPNRALAFNEDLWPTLHSDGTRRLRIALTGMRRARESSSRSAKQQGPIAMPRENDLEGAQDQGGKHGGQKGMPKPEPRPAKSGPRPGHAPDQGIVRDEQGQEQPRDKERAQQVSRTDTVGR